jgi:hypothetical protein
MVYSGDKNGRCVDMDDIVSNTLAAGNKKKYSPSRKLYIPLKTPPLCPPLYSDNGRCNEFEQNVSRSPK